MSPIRSGYHNSVSYNCATVLFVMKVIIFGASGETGRSIVKGLFESSTDFVRHCLHNAAYPVKSSIHSTNLESLGDRLCHPRSVSQQQAE